MEEKDLEAARNEEDARVEDANDGPRRGKSEPDGPIECGAPDRRPTPGPDRQPPSPPEGRDSGTPECADRPKVEEPPVARERRARRGGSATGNPDGSVSSVRGGRRPASSAAIFEVPTIAHFLSYSRTPQFVEARIVRALAERRPLDHMLVHGVPGSGTTIFARAIVRDYAPRRVVEIDAIEGVTQQKLIRAIQRTGDMGVLLLRHIELLDAECDELLACAMRGGPVRQRPPTTRLRMPGETSIDRIVQDSAVNDRNLAGPTRAPRFTVIATSHVFQRLGYSIRTSFDHLVHLRDDPKALRRACVRSLRLRGVDVDNDAAAVFERMVGTVHDCAETLVRACLERIELERDLARDAELRAAIDTESDAPNSRNAAAPPHGHEASAHHDRHDGPAERVPSGKDRGSVRCTIGYDLARSIVEEDLPCRLGDEHYAAALRRHLAGRSIEAPNEGELAELASKLGWSATVVRSAVQTVIREDAARRLL